MNRAALSFKFRFEELSHEGRDFADTLAEPVVKDAVEGLVGPLGYTAQGAIAVQGTVYRLSGTEVVVTGSLSGTLGFACARCLADRVLPVQGAFDHLLVKRSKSAPKVAEELVVEDDLLDEPDVEGFDGDHIDLSDLMREDLVLAVPMNPTCEDAVDATCERPAALAEPEEPAEAAIDPRWAPLLELKKKLN